MAISTQRTADQLALLAQQQGVGQGESDNGSSSVRVGVNATSERYVATATGSMLHRADCPVVVVRGEPAGERG